MFCVAVDESELLFNKTSSKEFLAILSDVGTALTEVIKCPHLLMCYEGAGSFLCITRDPDLPEWDAIEEALQEKLDHRAPIGGDDAPLSITLSVGTPIPPNANRTPITHYRQRAFFFGACACNMLFKDQNSDA